MAVALQQHEAHGLAHEQGAADDDRVACRSSSIPYSSSIRMTPHGVHARCPGRPRISRPRFVGVEAVDVLGGRDRARRPPRRRGAREAAAARGSRARRGRRCSSSMSASSSLLRGQSAGSRVVEGADAERCAVALLHVARRTARRGRRRRARPRARAIHAGSRFGAPAVRSTIADTCLPSMIRGSMRGPSGGDLDARASADVAFRVRRARRPCRRRRCRPARPRVGSADRAWS